MAKRRKSRKSGRAAYIQPDGKIRRSQLITTYGPGALVDLLHDAVLVSGLNFWRNAAGWHTIEEPRLRDRLAMMFKSQGRHLATEGAFRLPPDGDEQQPTRYRGIDALEFPEWFVCQNPGCRALVRVRSLLRKRDRYMHDCTRRGVECVPVRFLSACSRGHIDEFPWIWFVHQGKGCQGPSLRFDEGATGDFASMRISCEACGSSRALIDAKIEDNNPRCRGRRPWLGPEGEDVAGCNLRQRLLVRTASNAYFSQVESALSIPETGSNIFDDVKSQWNVLQAATKVTLSAFRQIPAVQEAIDRWPDEDVLYTVEAIKAGKQAPREPIRTAEYKEFLKQPIEQPGDLPAASDIFFARRAPGDTPDGISSVVLAHKLREVRVQVGFTRLEAASPNLQGEFDLGVRSSPLGLNTDWLPAVEILGEGIFVELDEEAVRAWEMRPAVLERATELEAAFEKHKFNRRKNLKDEEAEEESGMAFPGARFYLLHSLSHLLITALSLECGYSASAIRERIYCAPANDAQPMSGILLSTGSPGTEGTLGGLVEQGRDIERHLKRAWQLASLCSNDPVCAMHSPQDDLSDRNLDGAACHGCLYIAECSCEWFNRYLDRALVVPIIGQDPELAFFSGV